MLRWVSISIIRCAEEDGAMSSNTLNEHSRQLQLCIRAVVRVLDHVMMGKGVVTNGMTSVIDFLYQGQVLLHLQSYHKEGSRHIILLQRT